MKATTNTAKTLLYAATNEKQFAPPRPHALPLRRLGEGTKTSAVQKAEKSAKARGK